VPLCKQPVRSPRPDYIGHLDDSWSKFPVREIDRGNIIRIVVSNNVSRRNSLKCQLVIISLLMTLVLPLFLGCGASGEASATPGGTISPAGNIPIHGSQTFTMTPDDCYKVEDVTVNDVSVLADCTANGRVLTYTATDVTQNLVIMAYFTRATHIITSSVDAGEGSIVPSGAVSVNECDSQTFIIVPEECYDIQDVRISGVSMGRLSTFTFTNVVDDNMTISASFSRLKFTIKERALTDGGSIHASGPVNSPDRTFVHGVYDVSVECGNDQSFTMVPDPGYEVSDIQIDGISGPPQTIYTFPHVMKDHTIAVAFKKKVTHSIVVKSSECCAIVTRQGEYNPNLNLGFYVVGVENHADICFDVIYIGGYPTSEDFWLRHVGPFTPTTVTGQCWVKIDDCSPLQVTQFCLTDVTSNHTVMATELFY
jgi:hypothetical protein